LADCRHHGSAQRREAIGADERQPYGLTASIWTRDTDHAAAIGDRVETGTVFMNRCDYLDPALVWNGSRHRQGARCRPSATTI